MSLNMPDKKMIGWDYDKGNSIYVPPHFKMPQVTNPRIVSEMELCPRGPGTVLNKMVSISAATRDRAFLVNKTEEARLQKIQRMIDKEFRSRECQQNRLLARTTQKLKEKKAMLELFDWDYKVDNFITMKAGFDSDTIETKEMARKYIIESRVFNSGFNMKAMKPEVNRRLRKMDPNRKYRVFKKKLLEENKEVSRVEINRGLTKSAFHRMLKDRANWRQHNVASTERLLEPISSGGDVDKDNGSVTLRDKLKSGEAKLPVDETITDNNKVMSQRETDISEQRAKRLILEKRSSRRPAAIGITMRTLGPVYFQTAVSQPEPLPDIAVKE